MTSLENVSLVVIYKMSEYVRENFLIQGMSDCLTVPFLQITFWQHYHKWKSNKCTVLKLAKIIFIWQITLTEDKVSLIYVYLLMLILYVFWVALSRCLRFILKRLLLYQLVLRNIRLCVIRDLQLVLTYFPGFSFLYECVWINGTVFAFVLSRLYYIY